MGIVSNIDAIAEEKHRSTEIARIARGDSPYDGFLDDDGDSSFDQRFRILLQSTPVWVTEEMTDLAYEAALTMPPDFEPRDSDFGILPKTMIVGFAGETFIENCWLVERTRDSVEWSSWEVGEDSYLSSAWRFKPHMSLADLVQEEAVGGGWPAFWAFVLLANQKLAHTFHERPSRRSRRRTGEDVSPVVVVTLRRLRSTTSRESEESIAYTHRWMVQGHWRNQWYPTEVRHRPKWIAPYVKGPEDKPLLVKNRLFRVSR